MSTKRFLLQKILQLFLTLFLVTAITFILMKLSPIDAAEAYARRVFTVDNSRIELIREEMGLNRPLVVQYLDWLGDLLHLDLGTSLVDNKDVFLIVGTAAKETACVVLLATVLQAVGALILGTLLYLARKNFVGKVLGFISIAAISIPAFYLATSFIDVVAVRWNLMSVAGNTGLMRYLPAALCLAVSGIAFFGQMLSKTIQRAMNEDSVLYARCRGLSDRYIVVRYALPQAILSTVPTFMQMMGMCMAGSAIVENIFSLPGLGYRIVDSLTNRDLPVIYATVLFLAFALVIFNILADIIQRLLQTRKGGRGMKHLKWLIPVFIIAFCFLGFLIAPNDPEAMDIVNKYAAPSVDFPLGTDQFGRCELSRLLYGGKVTLGIVLLGGSIVLVLGTLIGLWLGRANAAKSLAFSSLLDAVTAIPPLAYLIIFVGIWGNSIPTMLVALTVSLILRMIKLVKTQTELELDKAYVLCAVSSGASRSRVLFVHILPNIIRPLVHFLCLSCAEMIMNISAFSFIGLTLGDDVIDWGSMLSEGRSMLMTHPSLLFLPILFIFLCTLAFNLLAKQLEGGEQA